MDLNSLQSLLQRWPTLREVWDTSFVTKAWEQRRLPFWLAPLSIESADEDLLNDLSRLEGWLYRLQAIPGFERLAPGLKSRNDRNWSHAYLEVDVLQHWESAAVLKEIQPPVPGRSTSADFLLDFHGTSIWGEITQFEALKKARVAPGVTKLLLPEEELQRIPSLIRKLKGQLPAESPALAVVNARRTSQRIETWEKALPLIFTRLPNILGIVIRGRVVTQFFENSAHGHLVNSLKGTWENYQLI